MQNLTLKQKIAQMFITGFNGLEPDDYFNNLVKSGLGGVIFFTQNIESEQQFKNLISNIKKEAIVPMFFSIDQEGGRVERTENLYGGKKYLSAKFAFKKGILFLQNQTKEIALELKKYEINMNFTPVLDVNTNERNPIIGERAFSSNVEDVIKGAEIVLNEYKKYNIITVGKHFPGHGEASSDSHKTLPIIDLSTEELENIHIKPFIEAIKMGCPAIMVAHVVYSALDSIPASVSKKTINDLLIKRIGFNGLIISDDMEMNGIKIYTRLEACIKAINAGVNMFIFRNTNQDILNLISDIENAVLENIIDENKIDLSVEKILKLKSLYKII